MEIHKLYIISILCGIFFVAVSKGFQIREKGTFIESVTDFDVLIFTQHWPQTVCYTWKEKSSSNTCLLPTDEEWTIHGVWPTEYHKIGPQYCNKSLPFDAKALATIEDTLKIKWIDVENGTAHYSFWKHEWLKHGTCAAVLPELNTEIKYFEKGLELLDKYDMKNILGQVNILPGNSYTVQEILKGVANVLGKNCQVECVSNKKEKQSYLFEIRICFDKSLELVDCDGIAGFPTNCPSTRKIIYPGVVPNDYFVIQI